MLDGDAQVDQVEVVADPVVALRVTLPAAHDDYRRLRHEFLAVSGKFAAGGGILHDDKPPRLVVAGGRGEAAGFQNPAQHRLGMGRSA